MKKLFVVSLLISAFYSCNKNKTETVNINEEDIVSFQLSMDSIIADTTKMISTELPILIDSARSILIHEVKVMGISEKSFGKLNSYSKDGGYSTNYITNLIFEEVPLNSKRGLTDLSLNIWNYSFQQGIYNKTGKKFIFYTITDSDSNKNNILDYIDVQSFYISDIDGTSFSKITKDNENFSEGKYISALNRYYFKTIEETDKYNALATKYFYYIDFNQEPYKVVEYFPLDILKK